MILDCNPGAMRSALIMVGKSDSYGPLCPPVGDLAQFRWGMLKLARRPEGRPCPATMPCPATIEIHRETTRHLYHFRGHGRVRQDHADAPPGGTLALPGALRHGNGGARRPAHRPENPADSARFGQPGTEPHHRDPALLCLARAKRRPVDPAGVGAR